MRGSTGALPLQLQALEFEMPGQIHTGAGAPVAAGAASYRQFPVSTRNQAAAGISHNHANSVNYSMNPLNHSNANQRFNQTSLNPLAGLGALNGAASSGYQPADINDMPAAGMPSERRSNNSAQRGQQFQNQFTAPVSDFQRHPSTTHNSTFGYNQSSHRH